MHADGVRCARMKASRLPLMRTYDTINLYHGVLYICICRQLLVIKWRTFLVVCNLNCHMPRVQVIYAEINVFSPQTQTVKDLLSKICHSVIAQTNASIRISKSYRNNK